MTGDVLIEVGEEITRISRTRFRAPGIERVKIRSVLTCETRRGVCIACYGRNLASAAESRSAKRWSHRRAVDRRAGTQLTMRTFHYAERRRGCPSSRSTGEEPGTVRFLNVSTRGFEVR